MSVNSNGERRSVEVGTVMVHRNSMSEPASVSVSLSVSPQQREEIYEQAVREIPGFDSLDSGTDIGSVEVTENGVEYHVNPFLVDE